MASAKASISFTCPNCAKVLRASARPAAGKKITCPACDEAFVPDFDDAEESATGIQSKPGARSRAKADDDDERPRSKRSRADDHDDEDDERPQKRRRGDDEDDEDRPIKKKVKKKSGGMLMMLLGIAGLGVGVLGCGLCGVGAWYFWPEGKADLEAFVDPNADMVAGGNPKMIQANFPKFNELVRGQAPLRRQANQQMEDITVNSERMLFFGYLKAPEKDPVVLFVSNKADIAKLKRNPNVGPAQTIGGHANVHKVTDAGRREGMGTFLAFPGSNIVIVSVQNNEADLIAVLNRGKQKPQPNATLEMARPVDKSAFWLALTPDAETKRELKKNLIAAAANPLIPVPALRNAAPAVDGMKGFTLAIDFDDKRDMQINARAFCKNAEEARQFKTGVEDAWTVVNAGVQMAGVLKQPGMPNLPPNLAADMNTMKFAVEDAQATARMKISPKTIEDMAKLGGQQKMGAGPGVGFAPPPLQPPIDLGPKKPALPNLNLPVMSVLNLPAGQMKEQQYQFPAGAKLALDWHSLAPAGTTVTLTVLQGAAGENVVLSDNQAGLGNTTLKLNAAAGGPYRIRIRNNGPGALPASNVFFRQE